MKNSNSKAKSSKSSIKIDKKANKQLTEIAENVTVPSQSKSDPEKYEKKLEKETEKIAEKKWLNRMRSFKRVLETNSKLTTLDREKKQAERLYDSLEFIDSDSQVLNSDQFKTCQPLQSLQKTHVDSSIKRRKSSIKDRFMRLFTRRKTVDRSQMQPFEFETFQAIFDGKKDKEIGDQYYLYLLDEFVDFSFSQHEWWIWA
jgi:hypothetical protein